MVNLVSNIIKYAILFTVISIQVSKADSLTDSKYAIVFDYSSNEIIFNKFSNERMHPSSMTKLMTVYVALKKARDGDFDLNKKHIISRKAWQMKGAKMFLNSGESITPMELIRGIIILSGNDASVALAEAVAGSEKKFAQLMNEEAKNIGLENSNFVNASGLSVKNHYMSAKDIVTLSIRLYEDFPKFYHIFSTKELMYANITQPNRNSLLGEEGVDGMKTGATDAGGYGLAFTAERDGRRIFAVVNGLKDSQKRHHAAKKLLEYSFNDFEYNNINNANDALLKIPVHYGEKSEVIATTNKNVGLTTKKGERSNYSVKINYDTPIVAPVKKGQKIGIITIFENDKKKNQISLIAQHDVKKTDYFGKKYQNLVYNFKQFFSKLLQ